MNLRTAKARLVALGATLGLLIPISLSALSISPAVADDAVRTATLVGALQSELGCASDWDPTCTTTDLAKDATGTTYSATFTVPAGQYEYKVAIDHAWDESYGPDGSGNNGPLALAGSVKVKVVYDDTTHTTTVSPTDLPSAKVTAADKALAGNSLRNGLTKERFYFLMADRFANGDTGNDRGGLTGTRLQTGFDPTDEGFYHGVDLS